MYAERSGFNATYGAPSYITITTGPRRLIHGRAPPGSHGSRGTGKLFFLGIVLMGIVSGVVNAALKTAGSAAGMVLPPAVGVGQVAASGIVATSHMSLAASNVAYEEFYRLVTPKMKGGNQAYKAQLRQMYA